MQSSYKEEAEKLAREIYLAHEIAANWTPDQAACLVCGKPWKYIAPPENAGAEGNIVAAQHLALHAAAMAAIGYEGLREEFLYQFLPTLISTTILSNRALELARLPRLG